MNEQRNIEQDRSSRNTRQHQRDLCINRRGVLRGGVAIAGGALAHRVSFPAALAARQATPSTPPGLTVGVDYFPSPMVGVPPAYFRLPEPYQSVSEVPGNGSTVTTLQIIFDPPPPPRDENRYWQELDARLGVNLEPTFVPRSEYEQRVAVTFAGGDLPDLMGWTGGPEQQQALQQGAYTDLTEYLTGDALVEYPNLANFSDEIWEGVKIQGRIWGVPRPRSIAGPPLMLRRDWAETVEMPAPANADEFSKLMGEFTTGDPNENQQPDTWGLGARTPFSLPFILQMFRVPNGWRVNDDGTLSNQIETDEYAAAIDYVRELFDAGFYHPDIATMNVQQAKDGFVSGAFGGYDDTITGLPGLRGGFAEIGVKNAAVGLVPPGHDGGQGITFNGAGNTGFTAIMTGRSDDRVRELLGVLNYFAAPFGSEEAVFLQSGLEGVHHDIESDGTRVLTEQGEREITGLAYLTNGPFVLYYAPNALFSREEQDEFTRAQQELARGMVEIGVNNPASGLLSETGTTEGAVLDQFVNDGITSLVIGRGSIDSLDQLVADWRERGGDQIRTELQESFEKAAG